MYIEERTLEIQKGWCFHSADFSLKASGKSNLGTVLLVRDEYDRLWSELSDEIKKGDDCPELYIFGKGKSIEDAIHNANLSAAKAKPIISK